MIASAGMIALNTSSLTAAAAFGDDDDDVWGGMDYSDYDDDEEDEEPVTEPPKDGYWLLTDTKVEGTRNWEDRQNLNGWCEPVGPFTYGHETKTSNGSFNYIWTCINNAHATEDPNPFYVKGNTGSASATYTVPKGLIRYNDKVTLNASVNGTYKKQKEPLADIDVQISLNFSIDYLRLRSGTKDDYSVEARSSFSYLADAKKDEYSSSIASTKENTSVNKEMTCTFDYLPYYGTNQYYMKIYVDSIYDMKAEYTYEWHWGEPTSAEIEEYGDEEDKKIEMLKRVRAKENPGDDGGTYIPPQIVVGTSAVAAFMGAAAGKKKRRKGKNKWDGTFYKLHILKNISDSLGIEREPVYIYAWIEALTPKDGKRVSRHATELDARITASSTSNAYNVEITGGGVTNKGKCFGIQLHKGTASLWNMPDSSEFSHIYIDVTFNGAANSRFTERIEFDVLSDPQIVFVDIKKYLNNIEEYKKTNSYPLISGDNYKMFAETKEYDEIYILLRNFVTDISDTRNIRVFTDTTDYEHAVEYVVERREPFLYAVKIKNLDAMRRPSGTSGRYPLPLIGSYPQYIGINIEASPSDAPNDLAYACCKVTVYPEGIYIDCSEPYPPNVEKHTETNGQCFVINTNIPVSNYSERTVTMKPTEMKVKCAYRNKDDEIVVAESGIIRDKDMQWRSGDKESEAILSKNFYDLDIKGREGDDTASGKSGFVFEPKRSLFMETEDKLFLFSLGLSYVTDTNKNYNEKVWLRFKGETRGGRSHDREVIVNRIKKLIKNFQLDEVEDINTLLANVYNMSPELLTIYMYSIYDMGTYYQQSLGRRYAEWGDYMSKWIGGINTGRFALDLIIATAAVVISGGGGAVATPLLIGFKEFCFELGNDLGEASAYSRPINFSVEKYTDIASGAMMDFTITLATGGTKLIDATKPKQLVITMLCASVVFNGAKDAYYSCKGKSNEEAFYDFIVRTSKYATVSTLKSILALTMMKCFSTDAVNLLEESKNAGATAKMSQDIIKEYKGYLESLPKVGLNPELNKNYAENYLKIIQSNADKSTENILIQSLKFKEFVIDSLKDRTYETVYSAAANSAGSAVDSLSGRSDSITLGINDTISITLDSGITVECPKADAVVHYVDKKVKKIKGLVDAERLSNLAEGFPKELQYIKPADLPKIYERYDMAAEKKYYDEMLKSCGFLDYMVSPGLTTEWVNRKIEESGASGTIEGGLIDAKWRMRNGDPREKYES